MYILGAVCVLVIQSFDAMQRVIFTFTQPQFMTNWVDLVRRFYDSNLKGQTGTTAA